jgi:hypothetical protein
MRKDVITAELPGVPKRPGRPPTRPQDRESLKAAAAARKRLQRARQADAGLEPLALVLSGEVADALRAYVKRKAADGEPLTMGEAAEKILRDRLLRKR